MTLPQAVHWLYRTPVNDFVMDMSWVWPICESLHFCAMTVMVGTVGTFDLRLLGLGKGLAPATLHRSIRWGVVAFAVSIGTGILFITGQPEQYFYNDSFRLKIVCLALLGINVLAFYSLEARGVLRLGPGDDASPRAKIIAIVSLTLLVAIMLCGRMLTFFRPGFIPELASP